MAILMRGRRRDVAEGGSLMLERLAGRGVQSKGVITKADKLKAQRRKSRIAALEKQLEGSVFPVIATSAQTKQGVDVVWRRILDSISDASGRGA